MTAPNPWSEAGYVTEVPYTREFLRYQTPLSISFAAWSNGLGAPDPTGVFDYLDLGCGEAITLMVLAACHPQARFVGVDMNPEHIASATAVASAAGLSNLELRTATFDEIATQETRRFDYIAAHGIYTWVNEDGRKGVRDVVKATLKPNGLFYLCHYVRPGADRTKALYDLVQSCIEDHAHLGIVARVRAAVADLRKQQEAKAPLFIKYPDIDEDLEDLEGRDDRYLAHEFGNRHFEPLTFAQVTQELAYQDLVFAGATRVDRNRPENRLGHAALELLGHLDRTALEVRMSYLSEESFRWDVFTRRDAAQPPAPALQTAAGHISLGPARMAPRMPRSERHGQRDITFDTPEIQAMLVAASTGQITLAELGDANPAVSSGAFISNVRDVVATGVFETQLQTARKNEADSQTIYRHGHPLLAHLFDRDFKAEAVAILPASVRGTAIQIAGPQAIITRMLDGRKLGDAIEAARAYIDALTPEMAAHLETPAPGDKAAFDRAAVTFLRRTMPNLLRWGVVEKE